MPARQLTTYQSVISQSRAYRALRQFMAESLDKYNLTVTEWLILGTVIDYGPEGARISDLATQLGVELPVITNLVNKAVATGWVQRVTDSHDKRAKRIVLSTDKLQLACDIEGELRESTKSWVTGVDKRDFDGYFTVISAISGKY